MIFFFRRSKSGTDARPKDNAPKRGQVRLFLRDRDLRFGLENGVRIIQWMKAICCEKDADGQSNRSMCVFPLFRETKITNNSPT